MSHAYEDSVLCSIHHEGEWPGTLFYMQLAGGCLIARKLFSWFFYTESNFHGSGRLHHSL